MSSPSLARAISLLDGDTLLAIVTENGEYKRSERGISALLSLATDGDTLKGACVADIIVGKAAAMLMAFAGVKEVYGRVMSRKATEVFERHSIAYCYGELTETIINRKGDGPCPMEMAVKDIDDVRVATTTLANACSQMAAHSEKSLAR